MGAQNKRFNAYRKYGVMRRLIGKCLWPTGFVETEEVKLWRRSQRGMKIKSIAQIKRLVNSKCAISLPERRIKTSYWPIKPS